MSDLITRWSSRKFITFVALLVLYTILLVMEFISEGIYVSLMLPTVGSYLASNVTQHIWGKR